MKFRVLMVMLVLCSGCVFLFAGCQRGDIKISPIIEGQSAPHDGYNIGPELWLEAGDEAKVTGAVIWLKGTDPNELFE